MGKEIDEKLLGDLIEVTKEVARGNYDRASEIFKLTESGADHRLVSELAESFGMMIVKIEAREYNLEKLIRELELKKTELEKTLTRVEVLENIRAHLGRFVPDSVRRVIETTPKNPDLKKKPQDVSVLFLDIGGYTRLSEILEAEKLNFFIEMYFSSFLDDIQANRGDINETAGDSLMVIFQDEDPSRHALNAVATGLGIQEKVQKINQDLKDHLPPFIVNIGINSGKALVGSTLFEGVAGSRLTYTASGSITNIAARIAQLATRGEILVGEDTAARIRDQITLKDLGPKELKNVKAPIRVFEVTQERHPETGTQQES